MTPVIHYFLSRQFSDVLAKIAPGIGLLLFVASVEVGDTGAWTDVWRITLSTALAVFVTLVGVIYNDMKRRQKQNEDEIKEIKEKYMPRGEYGMRHEDIKEDLKEIKNRLERKR